MPLGPSQGYLCSYNSYVLPGYVQNEQIDSAMNIAEHYSPFADGSTSEYTGLRNKQIAITLKVWEQDYVACKQEVAKAATMLRSSKGFAPLYVQLSDRYYEALTQTVKIEKEAGGSYRTLDYVVQFEAKPWYYSVSGHTITGTGTIDTDSVGRTIDNGGCTPTTVTVTGTNVTISGYTVTGDFAGFISISGAVTGMIINSNDMTATIGGLNKNNLMKSVDYRLDAGPGKTTYIITGASSCSIFWYDRWYL
jgi:hypothetical protein